MSRITLLLPDLEMGGAQRVILFLAKAFIDRGHNVDLVLLNSSGPLFNDIPKGVKVVDLAAWNFFFGQAGFIVSSVFFLAAWMRKTSPEVLLSTITGANLVALLARKISGVSARVVIREAVTLKNINSAFRLRAMNWLYPQADAIVALTSFMKEEFVANIGISFDRISCIANPVDAEFVGKQAQVFVDHPWLSDDQLQVVISVGRLIPQKDYVTLLRAFALLPSSIPARLIIVGEGPDRLMLERLAVKLGIADRIQLIGFENNPWRWLARADLFVLSSKWEGHPNALLEALVLGLPVVMTRYDASVDSLFKNTPSYPYCVVSVSDPQVMSTAIMGMIGSNHTIVTEALQIQKERSVDLYEALLLPAVVGQLW